MPVQCASCAATAPDGAKFCGSCGAPLLARCPSCGAVLAQAAQRFCLECGTALGGTAVTALPAPPAAEAVASAVERRQVSVLFADLTGFTSFSEKRDPEDVRETLSEYFASSRRIVESYGGRLEKFIGDAVMALWGAPIAHEDDAERSVRAGLDLAAAVTSLGDRLGVELRLRVGVLTGEAAVELDAIDEGMVIGDAINTASRIQSVAQPGTVLVDDVTRAVTEQAIAYEDAGAHVVKGKTAPVHTWRALRVVAGVRGAGRTDLELAMVGRDAEFAVLKRAFDALLESAGPLQLLSVIGEPGLGKSRLAWELKKYADGLAATVLWHHGQAVSFGHGAGFASLAEMVRSRAVIALDDAPAQQSRKLHQLVADAFAADGEEVSGRVLRALERLLGLDDGRGLIDLGELFSSWRLLFERLAQRDPVVLVFEDLHWADQGLFDFIEHLCEWATGCQILILVFSRPDERLDSLALRGERIDLAPLNDADVEALIAAAVEEAPPELLGSVREHAAGVPLFAVESLRMLADQGVMVARGAVQRYRLVGAVGDLDVPPSIHALVAARLDRLGELERAVLRGGAVLGQRFTVAGAAALAGIGDPDARSLLDGLTAKQFLTVDTDPRSQMRGTYAFVHRQVQRVILSTLSKRERKVRHLAAAAFLQGQSDPDLAAILAEHLVAALEAHPTAADADEIRQRALRLTLDTAQRADAVGALNEAIALFRRASEIEPDERLRAEHLVRAARCAERYGDQESLAAEHYGAARELHERAGRQREALRLRARELYAYQWTRPPADLIEPLREVYEALAGEPDAAFADAAGSLGLMLYTDGQAEAAQPIAAQAAAAARAAGAFAELGSALNCQGCALIELARPEEALTAFRAALELRERYAPSELAVAQGNVAIALAALGRFDEAVTACRRAVEAAERVASRPNRNLFTLQLARALFSLGQWDEAVATVESVAAETAPSARGMVLGPPLLVSVYRGQTDRARKLIESFDSDEDLRAAFESDYRSVREVVLAHLAGSPTDAVAAIERAQSGDYGEWPVWLPLAIDVLAAHADEDALLAAARSLARALVPKTSPIVTAQVARLRALLAIRSGDRAGAAASWSQAIDVVSASGMAFAVAALSLELHEHVPEQVVKRADLDAAIDTFTRLRADPWLQRARAARTAAAHTLR